MNKKIVVTGGSGFIGTNLLKKLSLNYKNIISNYHTNENFFRVNEVKYIKANLENKDDCKKICQGADLVIMCAANSSGAGVMEKTPLVHLTPNIIMNINMLEAAYKENVKKFIFISSNTVYPFVDFAVKENDANFDFYEKYYAVGWMKRFTEIVCDIYSSKIKNPMNSVVLRPGNLYGPYDKFDDEKSKVIPALIKRVVKKENPLKVWGDGNDLKDFLYIDDFCEAVTKVIEIECNNEIFNIASGEGITIKEILSHIINTENSHDLKIEFDLSKPTMIPKRLIDISKAKKILDFEPKIKFSEGIKKTILWYKENL
jgi:GDP-L-fucose synthase